MYILIIGAGEVGSFIARVLVEEGHDVAVIDEDEHVAQQLNASLNALVLHGSGLDPTVLDRAGIQQAELMLAVTAVDEVNLIACMTGRRHGRAQLRTVARVRHSWGVGGGFALSAEDLGLEALINPSQATAMDAVEVMRYIGTGELRELADGRIGLVALVVAAESPLAHQTLAEVRKDLPRDFLVVAVQGVEGIRIPTGDDRLRAGDRVFILTLPQYLTELVILSGQPWRHAQNVLLVGCGNTGLAVAQELERRGFRPMVIEMSRERAELVAGLLPNSLVLHEDGSDPELLSAHIDEESIDTVLVLLKSSETSVLLGIFAKSLGAHKVIVRCDERGYAPLAHRLGIDAVLSPKRAMINAILRYVRTGTVESILSLGDQEAEIIEFRVPDEPRKREIVEKPLKELSLPKGSLVGAVIRGDSAFIATGSTVLRPGDRLFVICSRDALRGIGRLLS